MSAATYTPQPGTIAARVIAFFALRPAGFEMTTGVLADELELDSNTLTPCLATPVKHGLLVRERRDGRMYWRRGSGVSAALQAEPVSLDAVDLQPPEQRVISAADAAPLEIPRFTAGWIPPLDGIQLNADGRRAQAHEIPAEKAPRPATRGLNWLAKPGTSLTEVPPWPGIQPAAPEPVPPASAAQVEPTESPAPRTRRPRATAGIAPSAYGAIPDGSTPKPALTPPAPMRFALWSDGTLQVESGGQLYATFSPDETRALVRYLDKVLVGEGVEC